MSFPAIKSTGHFFPSPQCLVDQIQVQTSLEVLKVTILGLLRYDIFINNLFLFRYVQLCIYTCTAIFGKVFDKKKAVREHLVRTLTLGSKSKNSFYICDDKINIIKKAII